MILGVTGKIASGKSEVLKILEKKGFFCINADKIVHELYEPGKKGADQIKYVFGKEFLDRDGRVDRAKLRELVFTDLSQLMVLNKVIHPLVYTEIQWILPDRKKDVAIEAVYFDEDFLENFVNKLVWVERSVKDIEKTLIEERGFPKELAGKAVSVIIKPDKVNFVIENFSDLKALHLATENIIFGLE